MIHVVHPLVVLCDTVLDVRHSSFPGESEVWCARVLSSATESLETEFPARYPSVTSRAWTISSARVSFTNRTHWTL